MPESRKRAPGAGRPALPASARRRRIQLYLSSQAGAFYEADDLPAGVERTRVAKQRKRQAVMLLERTQGTQ